MSPMLTFLIFKILSPDLGSQDPYVLRTLPPPPLFVKFYYAYFVTFPIRVLCDMIVPTLTYHGSHTVTFLTVSRNLIIHASPYITLHHPPSHPSGPFYADLPRFIVPSTFFRSALSSVMHGPWAPLFPVPHTVFPTVPVFTGLWTPNCGGSRGNFRRRLMDG